MENIQEQSTEELERLKERIEQLEQENKELEQKNLKETAYDKIPISVKTLDRVILVLIVVLVLFTVFAVSRGSLFR